MILLDRSLKMKYSFSLLKIQHFDFKSIHTKNVIFLDFICIFNQENSPIKQSERYQLISTIQEIDRNSAFSYKFQLKIFENLIKSFITLINIIVSVFFDLGFVVACSELRCRLENSSTTFIKFNKEIQRTSNISLNIDQLNNQTTSSISSSFDSLISISRSSSLSSSLHINKFNINNNNNNSHLFINNISDNNNSFSLFNNKYYYSTDSNKSSSSNNINLKKAIMNTSPNSVPPTTTQRLLPDSKMGDWERFHTHSIAGVLKGVPDIFDGITVEDFHQYPTDELTFKKYLDASLKYWVDNQRRGIWIKIPQAQSKFISILVESGFSFHHCQKDYIMLTRWLPENDANKLPDYTSHFIGCGGLVINEKNEILLITEKQRPDKWKIPGGALDAGEDICKTAVREVFEETGVHAEFVSVLGFRQLHNYAFDRGDIYFVCALRALSSEINMDPSEIAKCKWYPVEEFVKLAAEDSFPLQRSVARLAYEYTFNGYKGFKADEVSNSLRTGNSFVYHGSSADFSDLVYKPKREEIKNNNYDI
ncbi:hypothetical protein PPL_01926 [Heterostelium album PN500]|uniref:Nucleoside diphosphate-linked moiety X motif 6 n=1 Tax=Heterostelium pallidum (strain ATCC 26659 / Pp 5 / PN500) TaxID=670386 RepID=D3B0V9_HETP5|nr:hypothetical protein PPL_01926 [Heterostelium album PN500]EFA84933.1 hypothetical protein PPL_01926 [Heterostelium album PN500]|eukprot:XP_020437043.1 hypothetical protein PPL_01926 [Heterostelium album PN500]